VAAAPAQASPAAVAQTSQTAQTSAASTGAAGLSDGAHALTDKRLIDKSIPEQFFVPMASNAEMRFENMAGRDYTMPNSLFFVRSHVASVWVDAKAWRLEVKGSGVTKPYTLTYDDLLKLPSKTVTRYVECAGNGRSFFQTLLNKPAQGGQWHLGAYGVANWTGVAFSELLDRAGLKSSATEVMPIGVDEPNVRRPMTVAKAQEADTILAYAMNGDLLPIDHGFPCRAIVPGWVGVNNIKWVGTIMVTEEHNNVDWNTNLYVLIGPDYQPQGQAKGPPVNQQVLKSALELPWPAQLKAGQQKVMGYAWSPSGKIAKVEVSTDGGNTFQPATLVDPNVERAGVRWQFTFTAQSGQMTLTPRATDDQGNVQYPVSQQKWNEQGYLFGATVPHPVTVTA